MDKDHVRRLAKWICIFCYDCKSSVRLDWVTLPCDHLVCLRCFRQRKEFLKTMYECGCGEHYSVSAYDWIVTNTQVGHDEEMGKL